MEIREITDAAKADLAAELQQAELAEMKSIRDVVQTAGEAAPEPPRAER